MAEANTLGTWLRHERERRGVTLLEISEQTKLSVPMLQGLENDDLSRWPGGIFRRAFARSYATAIGVDPDLVVRRVEAEHPTPDDAMPVVAVAAAQEKLATGGISMLGRGAEASPRAPRRTAAIAALLDLLVAGAIGLGFAAAGSRLLWPMLIIAAYHACGIILTGRSPMLALLLDQSAPEPVAVSTSAQARPAAPARQAPIVRSPVPRVRQTSRRASRGSRNRGVA